jgi:hypothetical protein
VNDESLRRVILARVSTPRGQLRDLYCVRENEVSFNDDDEGIESFSCNREGFSIQSGALINDDLQVHETIVVEGGPYVLDD